MAVRRVIRIVGSDRERYDLFVISEAKLKHLSTALKEPFVV
jgi:hypothetical protein